MAKLRQEVKGPDFSLSVVRLTLVREEKEALTKALERLQIVGAGATPGGGARGLREVVRSLEDQLLRERAKSQRSATKRGQEQRLLLEQVGPCLHPISSKHVVCNFK